MVIQADAYNRTRIRTAVVAVLTSDTRLAVLPGNVFVPAGRTGLTQDSVVNVSQLATVDRNDLEHRIGALPEHLMSKWTAGWSALLGLR